MEEKIQAVLQRHRLVRFAILFGSFAKGRARASSDVDIAIAGLRPLGLLERLKLSASLSKALGREIDVIDLLAVHGVIYQQAMTQGKILIDRDKLLHARLLKKLWYEEADMMPNIRYVLKKRRERFLGD